MERLVICSALPVEVNSLCRRLQVNPPSPGHRLVETVSPFSERKISICLSGVGGRRMTGLLESLRFDGPCRWLSLGVAGGLNTVYRRGETVRGSRVVDPTGVLTSAGAPLDDSGPVLVSVEAPLLTVQQKAEARVANAADLVDMEAASVAHHAAGRNEPFLWIKAVSDPANEAVPAECFDCIDESGFPDSRRAMGVIMRKPFLIAPLVKMGKRMPALSRKLADAAISCLRELEQGDGCTCE